MLRVAFDVPAASTGRQCFRQWRYAWRSSSAATAYRVQVLTDEHGNVSGEGLDQQRHQKLIEEPSLMVTQAREELGDDQEGAENTALECGTIGF